MRYLTLAEALIIGEAVTGIEAGALARVSRLELLDSALHAFQAVRADPKAPGQGGAWCRRFDHLQDLGMRQARYRGRRKTRLQARSAATVANFKRLCVLDAFDTGSDMARAT